MDHRLGFYVFGISRARRMGIGRVLIHTKIFDILAPPNEHASFGYSQTSDQSLKVFCKIVTPTSVRDNLVLSTNFA